MRCRCARGTEGQASGITVCDAIQDDSAALVMVPISRRSPRNAPGERMYGEALANTTFGRWSDLMGYTHYYTLGHRDDLKIEEIGRDIAKLIDVSEVDIVDGMGDPGTKPIIDSEIILFNGSGEQSHESFCYPPDFEGREAAGLFPAGFAFTKTDRKPYGSVVAASLLAIKHHIGADVVLESDGGFEDEEWMDAYHLFMTAFPGRKIGVPLPHGVEYEAVPTHHQDR